MLRRQAAVTAVTFAKRALIVTERYKQLNHFSAICTRALSSEDKVAITELCYKFDHAINKHDLAAAVELFSPEGEVHSPKGVVKGASQLLQYFKMVEPLARGNRHVTLNTIVSPDKNGTAKVASYRLLHKACNPPLIVAAGVIEDIVVFENEQWKFAERRFIMDPPAQPPAA